MKKKLIYILLIIVLLIIGGLLVYKKFAKKDNPMKPEVALTGELTPNIIKLTNRYYQDNFLISPYSIKVALNMLKEGADGNTLAEIEQLLDKSTIGNVNNPNIKIANAVFISNEVKDVVEKSFVNAIRKKYNGEVLYDDFKTPEVINNWVNEHTDKMIPKILDSMDPNFIAGIANAVAIDVKWAYEFECHSTMSAPFTQRDNTIIDVEMMHNSYEREDVKYIDNDKITGIVLPYASDTNLEFIEDKNIIGFWKSIDCIFNKDNFNPEVKQYPGELYLTDISVSPDAKVTISFSDGEIKKSSYTNGCIYNLCYDDTACKYELKTVGNKDYMIIEWKSGDYVFGGFVVCYYVLEKMNN